MKKLLLAAAIAVGGTTVVADLSFQKIEAHAQRITVQLDSDKSRLNVRSGPGTNYRLVGKLKNGTVLTAKKSIYNKKEKRYYSLIRYKGKNAYVCNDYVAPTGPGAAG